MDDSNGLGVILAFVVALVVIWAIAILVGVFYCLTLQKALNRCAPQNRAMSPGLVWLYLIPLFNIVWHFFIVLNMAKSLHNEFVYRNMVEDANPGQGIGLATCILNAVAVIPYVGYVTGIAGFVCWIIYWVKISQYSNKIANPYAPPAQPQGVPQVQVQNLVPPQGPAPA